MAIATRPRILSLSGELARTDDDARHQSAERWNAALHRLCLLRATANESTYETEWARILRHRLLMDDLQRSVSAQLSIAALDVLEIQHEHALMVCGAEGIPTDEQIDDEYRELLAAMRFKVENDLP